VGAFGVQLAAMRLAHHLDVTDGLLDRQFEIGEINWLGQEVERATIHRDADIAHVAIGGDNDGRFLVVSFLQLLQQREAVHPRHVDV
jgi:hypothetical protein